MNNRIKVCIMLPTHFSSHMGGAEYQARILVDSLCRNGKYDLIYLCRRADKNYMPDGYQIRLVKPDKILGGFASFSEAINLYKQLKRIQPAIIYQNNGGIQTGVAGYYAKKHGVKFIWHIASDDNIRNQWKWNIKRTLQNIPQRLLLNYGIKNATIIAAQTRYQAGLLKKKFGIECKDFIPIGHPFPEIEPVKKNPILIVWIANLKPLKRPELFVRLAEHFRDRDDLRFMMIGRQGWGGWFKRIQKDIQHLPYCKYVGELSQDQVNQYLNRGHILVNTSRYEGFSNTFVQAWMRQVPVVSLTVDPDGILVREKIGFKSGSFRQLCQDVDTLTQDHDLRNQMSLRARQYGYENHSLEKMVSQAMRLFD